MNEHQRIGEAIGELDKLSRELKSAGREVLSKMRPRGFSLLQFCRAYRAAKDCETMMQVIADRIDEIRERMESGNR